MEENVGELRILRVRVALGDDREQQTEGFKLFSVQEVEGVSAGDVHGTWVGERGDEMLGWGEWPVLFLVFVCNGSKSVLRHDREELG